MILPSTFYKLSHPRVKRSFNRMKSRFYIIMSHEPKSWILKRRITERIFQGISKSPSIRSRANLKQQFFKVLYNFVHVEHNVLVQTYTMCYPWYVYMPTVRSSSYRCIPSGAKAERVQTQGIFLDFALQTN